MAIPNDPLFSSQWHLQNNTPNEFDLNVVDVWNDYTGAGVTVAVIDDGVLGDHPDLIANYDATKDYDLWNGSETIILAPESAPLAGDGDFHGTSVAGLIAATGNNNEGVVGIAYNSTLFGIKMGQTAAEAIQLISGEFSIGGVDRSADIVNMSLGTLDAFNFFGSVIPTFDEAVAMAFGSANGRDGKGTIYVKSAGNERAVDNMGNPVVTETNAAAWNATLHSISVAAVQRNGEIDDYSTPGSSVLVSAFGTPLPGPVSVDVFGPALSDGYSPGSQYTDQFNGTSAAAPQVSGVVALMLEANPNLGWRDVQTILANSAVQVGTDVGNGINGFEKNPYIFNGADTWNGGGLHFSNDYGFGLVDAKAAVRLAETWGNEAATTSNQAIATLDLLDTGFTFTGNGVADSFSGAPTTIVDIEHVQLQLNFVQTYDLADIELQIVAPDGTTSTVINNVSDDNDEVDSGLVGSWDYFYTNAFRGMSSEGNWTVQLIDTDSANTSPVEVDNIALNFYGSAATDNDTYILTDEFSDYVSGSSHSSAFNDAAGVDTLNAAAVDSASSVDLASGTGTVDGIAITLSGIENVYTGDGNDALTGDGNGNIFLAGRGNDLVNGGDGDDQATYLAARSNYTVTINSDGTINVSDRNASEGNDTLTNIEKIAFADQTVNLTDFSSTANLTSAQFEGLAEMYAAYFNRAPDAVGLYFWADKLAEGMSMNEIAEFFFDQNETRALYTDPSNTDAFVTAVYANVLGRTPDGPGFDFWKDAVSSGSVTQGAFVLEVIGGAKNGGSAADVLYLEQKTDLGIHYAAIRGMSNAADATSVFQTFGDVSTSNLSGARSEIDQHFADATAANGGEFLFNLVGVVNDPFGVV